MKKLISISVVVGLLLVAVNTANALTLSSVDGSWNNTVGGTGVNYPIGVSVAYGNLSEDQVRWGIEEPPSGQSGLGFTGIATGSSFAIGDTFEIGQLQHFNNPIEIGSGATATDLTIGLLFSDPPGLNGTFSFTLGIDETLNTFGPSSPLSDDIITFPSSYPQETFNIGGTLYTLQLRGFGNDPANLVDHFRSPEGGTNATLLWGQITTPNVIPAPGAILLGGIGVGLVGWLRRRRTL